MGKLLPHSWMCCVQDRAAPLQRLLPSPDWRSGIRTPSCHPAQHGHGTLPLQTAQRCIRWGVTSTRALHAKRRAGSRWWTGDHTQGSPG